MQTYRSHARDLYLALQVGVWFVAIAMSAPLLAEEHDRCRLVASAFHVRHFGPWQEAPKYVHNAKQLGELPDTEANISMRDASAAEQIEMISTLGRFRTLRWLELGDGAANLGAADCEALANCSAETICLDFASAVTNGNAIIACFRSSSLRRIWIRGIRFLWGADLKWLRQLNPPTGLTCLGFTGCDFNAHDIEWLGSCSSLSLLFFEGCRAIAGLGGKFGKLVGRLRQLRTVELRNIASLSADDLLEMSALREVRVLHLSGATNLANGDVASVLRQWKVAQLELCDLPLLSNIPLGDVSAMRGLEVRRCKGVSGLALLEALRTCPAIERVGIEDVDIAGDEWGSYFAQVASLNSLSLDKCNVSSEVISALATSKARVLSLSLAYSYGFDAKDVCRLVSLPLEWVDVSGVADMSDEYVLALCDKCPSLRSLVLVDCLKVTVGKGGRSIQLGQVRIVR